MLTPPLSQIPWNPTAYCPVKDTEQLPKCNITYWVQFIHLKSFYQNRTTAAKSSRKKNHQALALPQENSGFVIWINQTRTILLWFQYKLLFPNFQWITSIPNGHLSSRAKISLQPQYFKCRLLSSEGKKTKSLFQLPVSKTIFFLTPERTLLSRKLMAARSWISGGWRLGFLVLVGWYFLFGWFFCFFGVFLCTFNFVVFKCGGM